MHVGNSYHRDAPGYVLRLIEAGIPKTGTDEAAIERESRVSRLPTCARQVLLRTELARRPFSLNTS